MVILVDLYGKSALFESMWYKTVHPQTEKTVHVNLISEVLKRGDHQFILQTPESAESLSLQTLEDEDGMGYELYSSPKPIC